MDVVVERVAGLDIGKASMTVCVRTPGPGRSRTNEVRTYSTMTRQIQAMAAWLIESGVTLAAMESGAVVPWLASRQRRPSRRSAAHAPPRVVRRRR